MTKVNIIEAFKTQAKRLSDAVTSMKEKRSLSNSLAWLAFFIESVGMLQDKVGLKNLTAKGAECETAKGARSKAVSVYNHLKQGNVITVEGKAYDLAYFKNFNSENQPDIALSTLYSEMRKETREFNLESEIETAATIALESKHNMPLAEIENLLGAEVFEAEFSEAKADARKVLTVEAEAKKASNLSDIKKAIAALSVEQITEIAEYAVSLVSAQEEGTAQAA